LNINVNRIKLIVTRSWRHLAKLECWWEWCILL